jgi:hypothetical protein
VGRVDAAGLVPDAAVEDPVLILELIALQVGRTDQQAVVQVDVDELAAVFVQAEVVLDRRIARRHLRIEALVAGRSEDHLGVPGVAGVEQDVEIRVPGESRQQMLVALVVAVAHPGGIEGAEQLQALLERLQLGRVRDLAELRARDGRTLKCLR